MHPAESDKFVTSLLTLRFECDIIITSSDKNITQMEVMRMEKTRKARTLYQEHKAAFLAYFSLMLCNASNLVMDFMGIRGQNIPLVISAVLCLFMVIAMFRWL